MLNWKASIMIGVISLILFGCNNMENDTPNQSEDSTGTQPVRYESRQERTAERMGQSRQIEYPQSEQTKFQTGDSFKGPYSNEESVYIYHQLIKRKEILNAQVSSTNDRIIVSVMLEPHFNHESKPSKDDIEAYVREIVPTTDKDIIVYTDNPEWDKRKNDNARMNNRVR